jgi:hypothetical protein
VQPAVLERVGVRVGSVVVARHHDPAANQHLAVSGLTVLFVLRIGLARLDPHLDAGKRGADGFDPQIARARHGRCPRALRQAIRLPDVEAQADQIAPGRRIEPRPAGDQQTHARPQHPVDPAEEQSAQVDPQCVTQPPVQGEQRAEEQACRQAGSSDLAHDALVDQVEELRHAAKCADASLAQGSKQLGGVDGFQKHHARPDRKGQQQVGQQCERVEQWKHAEDDVAFVDRQDLEGRLALGQQVGVRQHDSLRVGRCTRGVEDDRRVVSGRRTARDRRRLGGLLRGPVQRQDLGGLIAESHGLARRR